MRKNKSWHKAQEEERVERKEKDVFIVVTGWSYLTKIQWLYHMDWHWETTYAFLT